MRRVMIGFALFGFVQSAFAADYGGEPYLRGSQPAFVPGSPMYYRWDGAYAGLQAGGSSVTSDFASRVSSPLSSVTGGTPISGAPLGQWLDSGSIRTTSSGGHYGGFIGYNAQWENAVLGIELNYNHMSISMDDARVASGTFGAFNVSASGASSVKLTDLATVRGRAGWVYDNWLPYGFVGLAIGRTQVSQSVSVAYSNGGPTAVAALSKDENNFQYGWALGAGVDWAITSGVFLRAEYEYTQLMELDGITIRANSARGAVGVRF